MKRNIDNDGNNRGKEKKDGRYYGRSGRKDRWGIKLDI